MTPGDEAIAEQAALIRDQLPKGWREQFVAPPWAGRAPACRGCGSTVSFVPSVAGNWAKVTMVKHDEASRTLRWSIAMLCRKCATHKPTCDRLALEVFQGPPMFEGPAPKVTLS